MTRLAGLHDVEAVIAFDGHRIERSATGVSMTEVLALKIECQLAGELRSWVVTDHPRPWETNAQADC